MTGPRSVLDDLCDLAGVTRRYEAAGELHEAPTASVAAVLRELGVPLSGEGAAALEDPAAVEAAVRALRVERWQQVVEPVSVVWEGGRTGIPVRVLQSESRDPIDVRIVLEDGDVGESRVEADEVEWEEEARLEGRAYRKGFLPLPTATPAGYHDVTVEVGSRSGETRLIRAPRTTWDGPGEDGGHAGAGWRDWGVFLPLYALRTGGDRGVGDLGDLDELARWTRERGGGFVGTLPLLPAFLGGGGDGAPFDPSPYAPVSRLFWNELYLDLERAPGLADAPEARRVLESAGHRDEAERLRRTDRVDYRAAMAHKRRVLEPLAREVAGAGAGTGFGGALEGFAAERPGAVEYARFRARVESTGRPWTEWPGEAGSGFLADGDAPDDAVVYHMYVQWAMDEQIRELAGGPGAELYLDLPLGCHPLGYDVWRHRDVFATGASGGAPPDAFFAGGQDWAFPPVHPVRARQRGHDYFIASLRHLMGVSGMLRLDHVMSLHRLFWVPAGGSPADGVYVRYPHEELWAALCLESRRHETEVVGEDLGTVPPEVPAAMERHGARRMWVLPFEVGPEEHREPPPRSVASLATHDLPPFADFWKGGDIERRVGDGHLPEQDASEEREARRRWREAVADVVAGGVGGVGTASRQRKGSQAAAVLPAALTHLAGSAARLVLVNMEDLWLEEEPQNVPGTAGPQNWTRRTRRTLEEITDDPSLLEILGDVARERRAHQMDDDET